VLVRACWEQNKDVSRDEVLHQVIVDTGFDADAVMLKANSAQVKQELRARTKEAKNTGICGVPSYRIFRRQIGQGENDWTPASDIVWGQDEIVVVEDLIAGWDGHSSARVGGQRLLTQATQSKL
jgi:2-hydroxychromene-2-carboxylate isomerase